MSKEDFEHTVMPAIKKILQDIANDEAGQWIETEEHIFRRYPFFVVAIERSLLSREEIAASLSARSDKIRSRYKAVQEIKAELVADRANKCLQDIKKGILPFHACSPEAARQRFEVLRKAEALNKISEEDIRDAIKEGELQRRKRLDADLMKAGIADPPVFHRQISDIISKTADLPDDLLSIRAGRCIEGLLSIPEYMESAESSQDDLKKIYLNALSEAARIPMGIIEQAMSLYGMPDGTIAHFRHNAANPMSFTGHGAFLRTTDDGHYQMDHISDDRVTYGRRTKSVSLPSRDELFSYLRFLQEKHWYSVFIDPFARSIGIKDMPFVQDSSFVSWKDRASVGDV